MRKVKLRHPLLHTGFSGFSLWHVVAATGTDFQSFLLAFRIDGLHAQYQLMHSSVISLVFTERKPEVVTRVEISDHACEAGAIVFDATDVHSFAPALLRQVLRTAGEADP